MKEKRHMSDLFFDDARPNDDNKKCTRCGKTPHYLKGGICYQCFFDFPDATSCEVGEDDKTRKI